MTNVLFVAVDRDLVNRVAALDGHRVVSIDRESIPRSGRWNLSDKTFRPDLIFVGSGMTAQGALEYAKVIAGEYPEIAVALVAEPKDELIRRVTGLGIRGVVSPRISDADLVGLLDRVGRNAQAVRSDAPKDIPAPVAPTAPRATTTYPHQVIVVASPKGGVGKTTTTVSLAGLLAESAPGEVVVIDFDLQFGNVATMLNLEPSYTVTDAFVSGVDDSMRLRTLLTPHPANFYVLASSDNPAENGHVTGDQIRKLVHHYSSSFRYVIVDTSAGLMEETLSSLEEATDAVFVVTLDVATLRAARREVEVLAQLNLLPQRRHVVLNRTDRKSGLAERDVERILGLPVNAAIPASSRVALSANRGELAVKSRRRNPVRNPMKDLAGRVSDVTKHREGGLR